MPIDPLSLLSAALLAAIIAGLTTNLLVPAVARVAEVLHALDAPDARKDQPAPVPRLGGIAIGLGIVVGAGGMAMANWDRWGGGVARSELASLAIGVLMVFLVGVVDDLVGVSTLKKLLVEVAAAWLIVRAGWTFTVLGLPGLGNVPLGAFGTFVALFWIVGVTNAINLIDGLDGLATGVVTIIAASLVVYAVLQGNILTVLLMAAVFGGCLGFLRHNWEPAKIYMGDSGSLTLGFLLAVMSLHSSIKAPAAVAILVPILALGVPVIDTLLVMLVRFLDRPKGRIAERLQRVFAPDRRHLHHLLAELGPRRSRIVGVIYALVLVSSALAIAVALTKSMNLGLSVVVIEIVVLFAVRSLGLRAATSRLSRDKRDAVKLDLLETKATERNAG
jgi:UDP-GlcNAc:undecaprenyl-phosphate GlcNAc-1-phosphate transferase